MKKAKKSKNVKSQIICNHSSRIRRLRLLKNLSQEVLAEKAGICRKTLSRLENGDDGIKCRTVYAVFKALGVNICEECVGCRDGFLEK